MGPILSDRVSMGRLPDWPARLARHILDATDRVFEYGVHDCSVFAADGVVAITGRDPIACARGRYHDEKRAAVVLREIGGMGVPEAADRLMAEFGAPPVHPAFAQRGDLVLIDAPVLSGKRDWCMGLIAPDGRVAVAAPRGLAFFSPRAAARAWSIGGAV